MGIRTAFRLASEIAGRRAAPPDSAAPKGRPGVRSPWAGPSHLERVVWSDIFGTDVPVPVTRADAMRVPAVAKGRSLIVGTLSRQPLAKFRGESKVSPEVWMYRTNTAQSPRARMLWTLDDCIFYGTSLWALERGARGNILDAIRVPPEWWEIDEDMQLTVYGQPVDPEDVALIEGPQDGLLEIAAETIAGARAIDRAWVSRVETPVPLMELHGTDPNAQLTPDEAKELTDTWDKARREGGTAYTPPDIEARVHGTVVPDLFTNGRNSIRLDIANYLGLPASLLDGSTATASLTYSTQEGRRNELVDLSLAYWATPVEARLSQDDIVPAGTRTAFDLEYLTAPTQPAQGPAHED